MSEWLIVSDFRVSYHIHRACQLVVFGYFYFCTVEDGLHRKPSAGQLVKNSHTMTSSEEVKRALRKRVPKQKIALAKSDSKNSSRQIYYSVVFWVVWNPEICLKFSLIFSNWCIFAFSKFYLSAISESNCVGDKCTEREDFSKVGPRTVDSIQCTPQHARNKGQCANSQNCTSSCFTICSLNNDLEQITNDSGWL